MKTATISTTRIFSLFMIALLVKAFMVCFFLYSKNQSFDFVARGEYYVHTGDSAGYLEPAENLFTNGTLETNEGKKADRMPGYSFFIYLLKLILPSSMALNGLIVFQLTFSALSCVLLASAASSIFNSQKLFYWVFGIYTVSTYTSIFDVNILTESIAASALISSFFFLNLALKKKKSLHYFLSGFFIVWAYFLRPFLLPIFILELSVIVFANYKLNKLKSIGKQLLVFILPFALVQGAWLIRNYRVFNEIVPTQKVMTFNDGQPLNSNLQIEWIVGDFVRSFGGDHTFWNPKGLSYWFFNEDSDLGKDDFPTVIFSEELDFNHLLSIKQNCMKYFRSQTSPEEKQAIKVEVSEELRKHYFLYKENHGFHFYFTSRLIHLKEFIFHSGVYNIPFPVFSAQSLVQKMIKGSYSILYLLVMIVGIPSTFILLARVRKSTFSKTLFLISPLFLVFLFPLVFKLHEYRFNVLAYPFLMVAAIIVSLRVSNWIKCRLA